MIKLKCFFLSEDPLLLNKQWNLMKSRMMQNFIWVFTVCKSTHLGVSPIQRVKALAKTHLKIPSPQFVYCI